MTLQIMNYCNDKIDVDVGELDDISTISILVLSGDEIITVKKKNGSMIEEDSDRHLRTVNFYDGEYIIYDPSNGVNVLDEWAKRKNSYDFEY